METVEVPSKRYVCRHIHTTGNRCGSPALKGEEFCCFHHATRRPARPVDHDYIFPDSTFDLPSLEDRPSIQLAVAVVARRVALNQIDLKRARLLLYALRIASTNLPREPHATEPEAIEQVEAIQHDPIHGPLAPVAEVVPKEERKGFAQRLIEEIREEQRIRREAEAAANTEAEAKAKAAPTEAILPEIQAVAEQPGAPSSTRSGRVGYRATLDRLPPTHPQSKTKEQTTIGVSWVKRVKMSCRRQTSSGSFAALRMTAETNKGRRSGEQIPGQRV